MTGSAEDPETARAPATADHRGQRCHFRADPGAHTTTNPNHGGHVGKAPKRVARTDPVCGMNVDPATAEHTDHDRRRYFFCSAGCRQEFIIHPDRYATASPSPAARPGSARD